MNFMTPSIQRFYRMAQERHPGILFQGDASRPEIALTFDDGPHRRDTPRLLEVLARHQVQATFHVVGRTVEHSPDLLREIHRWGHQIALHCYRHVPFPLETTSALYTGLERTRKAITAATGIPSHSIQDLRPPYGLFTGRTLACLTGWGFRLVMWNCMPPHWVQPVDRSIRQIIESIGAGGVIVLHDGHGHGKKVAEIVDAIVPRIRSRGLDFVTVQDMQDRRDHSPDHKEENP